jgi:RNA polymerase sigma-70 factor (ECF subfamily)
VATNRARDLLRRQQTWIRTMPLLVVAQEESGSQDPLDRPAPPVIDDDRLRLIFTCCHPSLAPDAQVALTLRLVCGLSTEEVARAFLVPVTTMAARITRAKKKIAAARVPFRVPAVDQLPARTTAVLEVVHLVFTTGHAAPAAEVVGGRGLVEGAIGLTRILHGLIPTDPRVAALLALMLLVDARRDSRLTPAGELVLLEHQDRSRWDQAQIEEGLGLLARALGQSGGDRFAVQAAIAAVHAEAVSWADTDWQEIVGLYDVLLTLWPSPVVELNRAAAVGLRDGPQAGLDALQPLLDRPALAAYPYLSAARADFLRRLRRWTASAAAYREALLLTDNEAERAFLTARLRDVESHRDGA